MIKAKGSTKTILLVFLAAIKNTAANTGGLDIVFWKGGVPVNGLDAQKGRGVKNVKAHDFENIFLLKGRWKFAVEVS